MKSQGKKVYVGLSGGVDSAVSAALLKEKGYEVTGVFIKAWHPEGFPCEWKEDIRSAMRVCAILDIPFLTLNLEEEYKEEVVDYMLGEYQNGNTPNPDVMCNKEIKFGHFLEFALKKQADYIATGHYAIRYENHKKDTKKYEIGLKEGKDKNKDQSYFLWTLTQKQLKHTLFPIGNFQKPKVREMAKKFGLPQATRKDSQGLCFLGKINMKEFLKNYLEVKTGIVLNEKGEKIGTHDGAELYTLGERKGLKITNKEQDSKPFYVVSKDIRANTLTVSDKTKKLFDSSKILIIKNQNWILESIPKKEIKCRWRYRQEKIKCKIIQENNKTFVEFKEPQQNISTGQSIVFYDGEICLGGAIID